MIRFDKCPHEPVYEQNDQKDHWLPRWWMIPFLLIVVIVCWIAEKLTDIYNWICDKISNKK